MSLCLLAWPALLKPGKYPLRVHCLSLRSADVRQQSAGLSNVATSQLYYQNSPRRAIQAQVDKVSMFQQGLCK